MSTYSTDPADLFTQLFDELPDVPQPQDVADWLWDAQVADLSSWISQAALDQGSLDGVEIGELIEQAEDPDDPLPGAKRRFALLMGLDRALAQIHPHIGTFDSGALTPIGVRYAETGCLSSERVPGALLPR